MANVKIRPLLGADFEHSAWRDGYTILSVSGAERNLGDAMKQEIFEQLKREPCACRSVGGKIDHEPRAIFQGTQDANIMQISQAPSIHVHNSGLPFHDASGKKLRREWYQIDDAQFYDEHNFYIASMGHCYPGKRGTGR